MRKLSGLLILCLLAVGGLLAQETSGGVVFSRFRQFRIPFSLPADGRVKQLQLYVSTDQGRSWQASATAPPEQRHFRFAADRDGGFWFAVQTVDVDNRLFPQSMEGATASLKVAIDTQPPSVTLAALPPRGNEIGVSWDVRDDNLDLGAPDAARLEYRPAGAAGWFNVPVPLGNQTYWAPPQQGQVDVRMRVKDRAGNFGEATTSLVAPGGGAFNPSPANPNPAAPNQGFENNPWPSDNQQIFNGPTENERKLVGSKRINLNYELKEVGPSGVSAVELWYTTDGRSWNKYPLKFGEDANQKSIVFDVANEGVYGISLVAKSGVGLGERPPQPGDRPQLWVEVDITKPDVKLHNVLVGSGIEKGKLSVTWTARDKNLHAQPMKLSYAEQHTGPWTTIADQLTNSGRHIWTMPPNVPYQFHLKVEAVDRAGNVGESATESLIKVDLAQPKAKITTVEPAGK